MAKGGRRAHSGRKKKPTDLKVIEGTFRGDRHGSEVQIPSDWPDPPDHLNARERALWVDLQQRMGAWTAQSDVWAINGVVSLVDQVLRIQAAQRATEGAGNPLAFKFTPSADGEPNLEPKENPLYGMELKAWRELRAYIGLTGLSPADRARVQPAGEEPPADALQRFLKR